MKGCLLAALAFSIVTAWGSTDSVSWKMITTEKFELFYTDQTDITATQSQLETGIKKIEDFFGHAFPKKFYVKVFPTRKQLDNFWRIDWNAPDFTSECWMVASGDMKGIAMLAPGSWKTESCDHDASNTAETQKLLTHELTHVFHYQVGNPNANEDLEPIGWFVEGLATYLSDQLDEKRMKQVRDAISEQKVPAELEKFWSGKARYGQSGSLVQWIDKTYGRKTIFKLLSLTKESQFLTALKLTESDLIEKWKKSIL